MVPPLSSQTVAMVAQASGDQTNLFSGLDWSTVPDSLTATSY